MTEPGGRTAFERELLARFPDTYTTSGGEVWVRYKDAAAALELGQEQGRGLLGMEGFVVGESVYASMSRIAEFSGKQGAYEEAKALLTGSWAVAPDDIDESAAGEYMICLVVSD